MANSDHNWEVWGTRDPYYAVLTDPRYRSGIIDANREAFFDGGQAFVPHMLGLIEQHFGALSRNRALDFGCGVGRLTIPLAGQFTSVVGVDISSAMLSEARRNSPDLNIDYVLSDDRLSQVEGTFDFINTCIVLQHIPVRRGMVLVAELLKRVRPGGGCLIHVSTKRNFGWRGELRYRLRHHVPVGQAIMNLIDGKPAGAPVMQMNEYSLNAVLRQFNQHGFENLLVRYEDHGGIDTAMILSRRS